MWCILFFLIGMIYVMSVAMSIAFLVPVQHRVLLEPILINCQLGQKDKLQWNLNHNTLMFIEENAFENVCEGQAILLWP